MPRLSELVLAFRDIMERVSLYKHHEISREPLSLRERMTHILSRIQRGTAALSELVDPAAGPPGVVVWFLATIALADTMRLGSGESVSVRLDLSGLRITKK